MGFESWILELVIMVYIICLFLFLMLRMVFCLLHGFEIQD
jgi:hypothetical protein